MVEEGYSVAADSPVSARFYLEARTSLPVIKRTDGVAGADDVFDAVRFQRLRLKENQQIPEWAGRPA